MSILIDSQCSKRQVVMASEDFLSTIGEGAVVGAVIVNYN